MKTIVIEMSDRDFRKLAGKMGKFDFKTLRKRVLADAFQQSINGAVKAARKSRLSEITLAEINAEINAVRNGHG